VEEFSNVKCRSTELLVVGSNDFCLFVVKQEVKYAASKTSQYQKSRVENATDKLVPTFLTEEMMNKVFTFTVALAPMEEEEGPSANSGIVPRAIEE